MVYVCASVCARRYVCVCACIQRFACAYANTLYFCVRDQILAWSISRMVDEQKMLGYARPEGIILCAEWN